MLGRRVLNAGENGFGPGLKVDGVLAEVATLEAVGPDLIGREGEEGGEEP